MIAEARYGAENMRLPNPRTPAGDGDKAILRSRGTAKMNPLLLKLEREGLRAFKVPSMGDSCPGMMCPQGCCTNPRYSCCGYYDWWICAIDTSIC